MISSNNSPIYEQIQTSFEKKLALSLVNSTANFRNEVEPLWGKNESQRLPFLQAPLTYVECTHSRLFPNQPEFFFCAEVCLAWSAQLDDFSHVP